MLPIGILGAVQFIPAQLSAAKTVLKAAETEEDAAVELTATERRAQRREAREAKTETIAAEPEITVEVVAPGFNGCDMQNADFGTMQTPFAGGFGMMPMPFGGFPGFGAVPQMDANGFPAFGSMPTTDANGFPDFEAMPNTDENTFNGFGAGFGSF